ncbi:chromosomal replication initiator protein DnaA, partial [Pseudomonas sp. SIMBA_059]
LLELLGENGSGIAPALSLLIGSRRSSAPRAAPNAPVSAAVAASLAQTRAQTQPQRPLPVAAAVEPAAVTAAEPVLVNEMA